MWNLKTNTNEHIYNTLTDLGKTNSWLPKGCVVGKDKLGV